MKELTYAEVHKKAMEIMHEHGKPVVAEQPPPTESKESRVILDLVLEDFCTKAVFGMEKYGTMLMSHNGRDALIDLYEELIDACLYLRQAILERDGE